MTDAYYELIDPDDPLGERFAASEHVISTWASTMQNAAPVSALLVRALERCAARDDTRISRVVVDLLGPVPVTDRLWTRAGVERRGTKIELVGAEMLAPGPDGEPRPVAKATAWRFQRTDGADLPATPVEPLRPVTTGRRRLPDDGADQTYIQSLDWRWLNDILNSAVAECWARPLVDLVAGEPMTATQRLFAVADIANGMGAGSPRRVDVPQHRSGGAHPPAARRAVDWRTCPKSLRPRRSRHLDGNAVPRGWPGGRHSAGAARRAVSRSPLAGFTVIFTVGLTRKDPGCTTSPSSGWGCTHSAVSRARRRWRWVWMPSPPPSPTRGCSGTTSSSVSAAAGRWPIRRHRRHGRPVGYPFHQRVQRLRHRGQRHQGVCRRNPVGRLRHRHRRRVGQASPRRLHRRSRLWWVCRPGTPRTVST